MYFSVSEKGKPLIVEGDYKYRKNVLLKKKNVVKWRCTSKNCSAYITTDIDVSKIEQNCDPSKQNHDPPKNLQRGILSNMIKIKSITDV